MCNKCLWKKLKYIKIKTCKASSVKVSTLQCWIMRLKTAVRLYPALYNTWWTLMILSQSLMRLYEYQIRNHLHFCGVCGSVFVDQQFPFAPSPWKSRQESPHYCRHWRLSWGKIWTSSFLSRFMDVYPEHSKTCPHWKESFFWLVQDVKDVCVS